MYVMKSLVIAVGLMAAGGPSATPAAPPVGGKTTPTPLSPGERVELALHELGEFKRYIALWEGKKLAGYVLDYTLSQVAGAEDAVGPLLLAEQPPRGRRVKLAMEELGVLRQEMKAHAGQKLEGDALARLRARAEAAEQLLGPDGGNKP
jgi:hypothetical protein